MHRMPLPFTNDYLLLTPRWSEWGPLAQFGLLFAVCLVPVALVLWLCRWEMRLVSRPTAVALLGLRLLVLSLVLFLVLAQPILGRSHFEELPGVVLVAVDRSESTEVADPQRPAAEKLRLARALRLTGDRISDKVLEHWLGQYATKGMVGDWLPPDERPRGDEEQRLRNAEYRRTHDELLQKIDSLTRSAIARRLLGADGASLLGTLTDKHHTRLLRFAADLQDVPPDAVDTLFAGPPTAGTPGAATDLRQPLLRALEASGPNREKVLGIVLLTDGRHNAGGPPPESAARALREQELPIFPIALGPREPPADVLLVAAKAPAAVFKDVDGTVEATVQVTGIPKPQDLRLELCRLGQEDTPLASAVLQHDGTDREYSHAFPIRLSEAGTQTLVVVVKPADAGLKEVRSDNNRRTVVINVADDKAKVLLVDGEARWEFHYLAGALLRDRTMQLQSVVFQQPRIGRIDEEELARVGNPRRTLPTEPDALAAYDCVILGDVTPGQLAPADRQRLERYVADRGGTLILLAGKHGLPLGFPAAEVGEPDPLSKLLPIETPRPVRREQGFAVGLTHEGRESSFLRLADTTEESDRRWAGLPKHYWGVLGRAKPGAVVLATAKDGRGGEAREQALVARQNYGFGRVLYVGLDSTWRWRYKVGDAYHHRFWGQVIRWAASDKPLVAGNEHFRFGTREPVYRAKQPIELTMRLGEDVSPQGATPLPRDAEVRALVRRVGANGPEDAAQVTLRRREAQPRLFEGRLEELPPGQYAVELDVPGFADKLRTPDGKGGPLRATFTVAGDSEEMTHLAVHWDLLEKLASETGGKAYAAHEATEVLERLRARAATVEHREENRLWQGWPALLVLVGLLTVEWVGRKLAGLP